jgi:chromosomal replication initiation ATPase DnaA
MSKHLYRVPITGADRARAALALHLAAAMTDLAPERVAGGGRGKVACRARWLALYLTYVVHGWTLDRVGHAFGVTRSTVVAACRWGEQSRDVDRFDKALNEVETLMRAVFDGPALEVT